MPFFRTGFQTCLILLLLALSGLKGFGQCSIAVMSYTNNVAVPVQIAVTGTAANVYTWHFGDGSADTATADSAIMHVYADTGQYNLCVYGFDSVNLCYDTICQVLNLACNISGAITFTVDTGASVTFVAALNGIDILPLHEWIVWNTQGGVVYNSDTLSDTLSLALAAGNYTAAVVVSAQGGCVDTIKSNPAMIPVEIRCRVLQQGVPQSTDTYIRSDLPNINFGLSPDFLAQQWYYQNIGQSEARGLMKFDLSSIPAGSNIVSASITLYADSTTANSGNGYPGQPTYGSDNASVLKRITAPWQQLATTWSNQPATTSSHAVAVPQSTDFAQNYTLDITSFIQFWVQHPDSNYGVMLSMNGLSAFNNLIFCSSAHPNPALRPALNICYIAPVNSCDASFSYNDVSDSVHFYNQSYSGDSVIWNFDDGDSSSLNNPVHGFALNGLHQVTLHTFDSAGSCTTSQQVNVNGIVNDTLCGVVFFDSNNDNLYDNNDAPLSGYEVVIDGNSYLTDFNGFYRVPVGGGGHIISVNSQFYTQSSPLAPENYAITTTNYDYICGLDFGMTYGNMTAVHAMNNDSDPALRVFPNPVTGNGFNISLSPSLQTPDAVLLLTDMLGRQIAVNKAEQYMGGYRVTFDQRMLPGIYTIQYISSAQKLSAKLMVAQ